MSTAHLNKSTPCADCQHPYGDHCESGMPHFDAEDHVYNCIVRHCVCGPCQCPAFRNPLTGKVAPWTRPTLPETPCARCTHPKAHHCRKGSIGIVVDGVPHTCSHYLRYLRADFTGTPECSDTRCAEILDVEQEQFCPCRRFKNPYLRPRRKRAPMTPLFSPEELQTMYDSVVAQQPPKPKTKAEILLEVVTEDPTCTVAELSEWSSRSKSWVRKHLKAAGLAAAKPVRGKKAGEP
jgi:hypothetical protein